MQRENTNGETECVRPGQLQNVDMCNGNIKRRRKREEHKKYFKQQ